MIAGLMILLAVGGLTLVRQTTDLSTRSGKFQFALLLMFVVAVTLRVAQLRTGMGLDLDEAQGGYNSWSLANYGVDDHLAHLPVYLYAWGSGMNVLYPMLAAPIVKLFGLSVVTYRLPMAMTAIAAILILLSAMLRCHRSNREITVFSLVLWLSPITITTSRWAVESNIVIPLVMIIWALYLLFAAAPRHTARANVYLGLLSLTSGLSAYAYSNNWLFLAVFVSGLLLWLWKSRQVTWRQLALMILVLALVIWPLGLFMYVNYVSHQELHILGMTITKLATSRSNSQFVVGHGNPLFAIGRNLGTAILVLVTGNDGMIKSTLPFVGAFYPGMLLFAVVGLAKAQWQRRETQFMVLMLVGSLPTLLLIKPNFVHYNALMIPLLFFEAAGILSLIQNQHQLFIFGGVFSMAVLLFSVTYFGLEHRQLASESETTTELAPAIAAAEKQDGNIEVVSKKKGLYAITRFYAPISPYQFAKEKQSLKPTAFMYYQYYGRWRFTSAVGTYQRGTTYLVEDGISIRHLPRSLAHHRYGNYTLYYLK